MKLKLFKKLRATLSFNRKNAKRQMNVAYYRAQAKNMKQFTHLETEKKRRGTQRWDFVTEILDNFKEKGYHGPRSSVAKTLHMIYEKNAAIAKGQRPFEKTTNILKVISKPETLMLAYKRLKRNKGAMSEAADVDRATFNSYSVEQKELFFKKRIFPDGFSIRDIYITSRLVRKGIYPWGSSRRIWLEKAGDKTKKRPITIPPFLDRLVQEAIKMVLVAIYEPYFEKINRSFGFRPNKSCHDAITALNSNETLGLNMAIEGDIQSAYDNVKKKTILELLGKKIQDNRFMRFMKKRLDYDYVDSENKERVIPVNGIPQGGLDSPYLFNIYLLELDEYVQNDLKEYLKELNESKGFKASGKHAHVSKPRRVFDSRIRRRVASLETMKKKSPELWKQKRRAIEKEIKAAKHRLNRMAYYDSSLLRLRLFYVRYADDWILLTNGGAHVAEELKRKIKSFLIDKLSAVLSDQKTAITNIKKHPAHFLGFELRRQSKARLMKVPGGVRRVGTFPLTISPDKQRIINRLHMKGFCDKKGFPLSIPWISNLEPSVIIERFNASIRGFAQYYAEWVSRPSEMSRWIYILRYSCLKTLAQKYKSTINKIFKRFGTNMFSKATKTVAFTATLDAGVGVYKKRWELETYLSVKEKCLAQKRWVELNKIFVGRERGDIGNYPLKPDRPTVTHENFVDKLTWVSLRTQASLGMPCAICGTMDNVEMHHIRHIRKQAYTELAEPNFLRVMALRNRKQIPVCFQCHRTIDDGEYQGPGLRKLISLDNKLVDNRVLHVESFVKPGREYHSRPLEERGWKKQP